MRFFSWTLWFVVMWAGVFLIHGADIPEVSRNRDDEKAGDATVDTEGSAMPLAQSTTTEVSTETPPSTSATTTIPPTTFKPIPPNPSSGAWVVTDGNHSCIMAKLSASFIVPYTNLDGKVSNSSLIHLPSNATSSGSCLSVDDLSQEITLKWPGDNVTQLSNSMTLVFLRNSSNQNQFYLGEFKMKIYPNKMNFPNITSEEFIEGNLWNATFYITNVNKSYLCNSEDTIMIPLNSDNLNQSAVLRLSHVQVEAFRNQDEGNSFSTASVCPADGMLTSDIVPIAVGCALAALVVVVLIAYLIGRRRARQRGYQSV